MATETKKRGRLTKKELIEKNSAKGKTTSNTTEVKTEEVITEKPIAKAKKVIEPKVTKEESRQAIAEDISNPDKVDFSFLDTDNLSDRDGTKFQPFSENVADKGYAASQVIVTNVPKDAIIPEDVIERPVLDFQKVISGEQNTSEDDSTKKTAPTNTDSTSSSSSSTSSSSSSKPFSKDVNDETEEYEEEEEDDEPIMTPKEKKESVAWLVDMSVEAYKWAKQIAYSACVFDEDKQRKLALKGKFNSLVLGVAIDLGGGKSVRINEVINDYNESCADACNIDPISGEVVLKPDFEARFRSSLAKLLIKKNVVISEEKRFLITILYDAIQTAASLFSARMTLNGILKIGNSQLNELKRKNDIEEAKLKAKVQPVKTTEPILTEAEVIPNQPQEV